MIEFTEIKLRNLGILQAKLPDQLWSNVRKSIETQIENKNVMKKLKEKVFTTVSGIEETITIQLQQEFHTFVNDLSLEYMKYFDQKTPTSVKISSLWANLQKKYEYRPYHYHYNKDDNFLSFVLYYNIPYDLQDEDSLSNHHHQKSEIFRNSRLEFMYNAIDGSKLVYQLDVDKSYEGTIVLFPNTLYHMVYPFYTSDDYRISIAGNCQLTF